jgi:hypothetical protein
MTFLPDGDNAAPHALPLPQLHLKVAEYLEQASRLHREAAKLHAAGETRAADLQVMLARYQLAKVQAHVVEAGRQRHFPSVLPDSTLRPPAYETRLEGNAANASAPASSRVATVSSTAV